MDACPNGAVEPEARAEPERQARPAFRPSAAQLTDYPGSYYSEELATTWDLVIKQDSLYVIGLDDPFTAVARDEFRLGGLALHFERDAQGRVVGLSVDAGRVRGIGFVRERS